MNRFFLFSLLALLFSPVMLRAQCPTNITLTTQAAVNAFPMTYPGCTAIPGNVIINGTNITNLDSLAVLTSIGGNLQIGGTGLQNLTGLSNLTNLGSYLSIGGNTMLTSLNGLQGITVIHEYLTVQENIALTSLTGLNNLTTVGGQITFNSNHSLPNVAALSNLDSIGSNLSFYSNNTLNSFAGLENITVLHGGLNVVGNNSLSTLTGLNNLTSAGGIALSGNPALANLLAFSNLNHVGNGLTIGGSPLLTSLAGLDSVHHFGGNLLIYTNANLTSLAALGNINSLGSIISIGISGNALLPNLMGLESFNSCTYVVIDNNPSLSTLAGLQNIASIWLGGLVIDNNDALTSLSGLSGLTGHVGCRIDNNAALTSLDGVQGLTSIGGYIRYNPALTSLTGLNNVATMTSLNLVANNALPNLAGLGSLANCTGVFSIEANNSLTSLTGLGSLLTANRIEIKYNPVLLDLTGLDNLTTMGSNNTGGGELLVEGNAMLQSLNGLQNLTGFFAYSSGVVNIKNNQSLTSLNGLNHLKLNIGQISINDNDALPNLNGLDSLTSIQTLIVSGCAGLQSLAGLEHLATISSYLQIYQCPLLANLSALSGLTTFGTPTSGALYLWYNANLENCSEPAICTYLNGTGPRNINDNDYGALSPAEVIADCNGQMLTWYRDGDNDTYGNTNDHRRAVTQPTGFVADDTDCNDSNGNIYPGAAEICGNLIDENCNGLFSEPLTISLNALTNASCSGNANGAINIDVLCGKSPLTFLWSNGATTEDIVNIPAGTYTVTTTDNQGLSAVLSATITQSAGYTVSIAKTNITCFGGNNGTAQANVPGSTTGYTFVWSNGATTRINANLSAGTYTVTATKISTGCTRTASATLTQPTALSLSFIVKNPLCNDFGYGIGSIKVTATGGTGTKTYLWNNGNTGAFQSLGAGTYTVTATDTKGCTVSGSATLTAPPQLNLSYTIEQQSNGNYRVQLFGSGGTPYSPPSLYRYCNYVSTCTWTAASTYSNLLPNSYYGFYVRDRNACINWVDVYTPATKPISPQTVSRANASEETMLILHALPNPFKDVFALTTENTLEESLQIQIFDQMGRLIAQKAWQKEDAIFEISSFEWQPGIYEVKAFDRSGRSATTLRCLKI